MVGEALRLAVELHYQPMLRHGLRQRALPADIEEVLLAAGGSPARLARLVEALGLPADEVLQAARFFVQELLLHVDADAYRVLGVDAGADNATIKRHYRALQQWLHPDRLANSAESIYSARVNRAWGLLRTPERRKAFDAASAAAGAGDPAPRSATGSVHVQRWERVEYTDNAGWRPQLVAILGLFVLCVALLWLALRETPVPSLPESLDWARHTVEEVGSLVSKPDSKSDSKSKSKSDSKSKSTPDPPLESRPGAIVDGAPITKPVAATPLPDQRLPESSVVVPLQTAPAPVAAVAGSLIARTEGRAIGTVTEPPTNPPPPSQRVSSVSRGEVQRVAPAARAPESKTASINRPETPVAVEDAADAHRVLSELLLVRHEAAREQAGRLLTFLTGRNVQAPPIWRNVPALESAEAIHGELTRGARFRRAGVEHDQAHWEMGEDVAVLAIPISPADRATAPRSLQARLVWHEGAWWVDAVSLDAGQ